MDLFRYPYGATLGEYVVVDPACDDGKTLVYSTTSPRMPKFFLIVTSIHQQSPVVGKADISREDLMNELIAFKYVMTNNPSWSMDTGMRKLLTACDKRLGADPESALVETLVQSVSRQHDDQDLH